MEESPGRDGSSYTRLKEKQRSIRAGFRPEVGLRVHRAISWLQRAEQEQGDLDAAFIFYWISFNAAYADDMRDAPADNERSIFDEFFRKLTALDQQNRIYNAIWQRYPNSIRLLLDNRYVFAPFWKHQNGLAGNADWETRFESSKRWIATAVANRDTRAILSTLFDRLYVLRNQLVHGGATWSSSVNRDQVRDGVQIIATLVPIFIELIMDHPDEPWGAPYYPVVD